VTPTHDDANRRPMNQPRLIAFDLDDTLAPSKSRMDPVMADLLGALLDLVPVCIISGGRFEQFSAQVLTSLPATSHLSNLHLMPTCGTVLPTVRRRLVTDVLGGSDRRREGQGRRCAGRRGADPGPGPGRDLGTDDRGPRQPGHLLGTGPGRPGGGEEEVGSLRCEEGEPRSAQRERRCAPTSPRGFRISRCAAADRPRWTSPARAWTSPTA